MCSGYELDLHQLYINPTFSKTECISEFPKTGSATKVNHNSGGGGGGRPLKDVAIHKHGPGIVFKANHKMFGK